MLGCAKTGFRCVQKYYLALCSTPGMGECQEKHNQICDVVEHFFLGRIKTIVVLLEENPKLIVDERGSSSSSKYENSLYVVKLVCCQNGFYVVEI